MSTATTTNEPQVWIGCLACYNAGRLVGEWFPAVGADEVTLAQVHRSAGGARFGCEELWVMDHEHIPVRGEMDTTTAAAWGEAYQQAPDGLWEAVCAWVDSGAYVAAADASTPSLGDFEERYTGQWDSFEDYAEHLAGELDLFDGWPETARRYFDWTKWVNDLRYDYTVCDAPGGGVYVFRDL